MCVCVCVCVCACMCVCVFVHVCDFSVFIIYLSILLYLPTFLCIHKKADILCSDIALSFSLTLFLCLFLIPRSWSALWGLSDTVWGQCGGHTANTVRDITIISVSFSVWCGSQVWLCVYTCVCLYVCVRMCAHLYVCVVCVYMCVCVCACACVWERERERERERGMYLTLLFILNQEIWVTRKDTMKCAWNKQIVLLTVLWSSRGFQINVVLTWSSLITF